MPFSRAVRLFLFVCTVSQPVEPILGGAPAITAGTHWVLRPQPDNVAGRLPSPDVILNEIMFDVAAGSSEWIELYNRSSTSYNLCDFTLADDRNHPVSICSSEIPVEPGAHVVLVQDQAAFQKQFGTITSQEVRSWPALNDSGDRVLLYFGSEVMDSVRYEPGIEGRSLERVNPDISTGSRANWGQSTDDLGATPGMRNSIYHVDEMAPRVLFTEQKENNRLLVWMDEPVDPISVTTGAFSLNGEHPDIATITGEQTVLLEWKDLDRTGHLEVNGIRDWSGNDLGHTTVEIHWRPEPREVVINEIMYQPLVDPYDGKPDQMEYLELYNDSDLALALDGVMLAGAPDENGHRDTLRFTSAYNHIHAGGYAVATQRVEDAPPPRERLSMAFPDLTDPDSAISWLQIDRSSLNLTNSGRRILLLSTDGLALDSVDYNPEWHSPYLEQTEGVSLERRYTMGPYDGTNWSSSVNPHGGTPGYVNSITQSSQNLPDESKDLVVDPSPFSPDGDGHDDTVSIGVRVDALPAVVRARIFDSNGRLVRTLTTGAPAGPSTELIWDGLGDDGQLLRIGIYVILLDVSGPDEKLRTYKNVVVLARPL